MTHDKAPCEFCQAVATMDKIMAMLDGIPEFGVPLFDDAVQAVYEAAQDAKPIWRCQAAYDDEQLVEDERVFGKDAWVYCMDHVKPHPTGWCGVGADHKVSLGTFEGEHAEQARQALAKCRLFGLPIYGDAQNTPK